MGALLNIYFKLETLEKIVKTLKAKNETGITIDLGIQDETNNYGQNVSGYISQSKEQRESKTPKFYVGNGKVFWTDGTIKTAVKKDQQPSATSKHQPAYEAKVIPPDQNDLPF